MTVRRFPMLGGPCDGARHAADPRFHAKLRVKTLDYRHRSEHAVRWAIYRPATTTSRRPAWLFAGWWPNP